VAVVLALTAAACGGGDSSSETASSTTAEAAADLVVPAAQTGESANEANHDHDGHHDHEHGGHHDHDTAIEVAAGLPVPTVTIQVIEDPASGWNLHADTSNFEIVPQNASTAHIDGQGHMHLYINGEKISRLYGAWHHIDSLQPGENLIRVELSANDHSPMAVDGQIIDDTVVVMAPESDTAKATSESDHDGHDHEGHDHDHGSAGEATPWDADLADATQMISVDVADGKVVGGTQRVKVDLGSVVALMVISNTEEEVHVHGYDILRAVAEDSPAHFAFRADIPGVFEVELEGSGQLLRLLEIS